jgi:gas vesicle protein
MEAAVSSIQKIFIIKDHKELPEDKTINIIRIALERVGDEFESDLKEGQEDAKEETREMMENLKEEREDLKAKMQDLENQSKDNWEEFKTEVNHDLTKFKESVANFFEDNA